MLIDEFLFSNSGVKIEVENKLYEYYSLLMDGIVLGTNEAKNSLMEFINQKNSASSDSVKKEWVRNKKHILRALDLIRDCEIAIDDTIESEEDLECRRYENMKILHENTIRFPGFGIVPSIILYHQYQAIKKIGIKKKLEKENIKQIIQFVPELMLKRQKKYLAHYWERENERRIRVEHKGCSIKAQMREQLNIDITAVENSPEFEELCNIIEYIQYELGSSPEEDPKLRNVFFDLFKRRRIDVFDPYAIPGQLNQNKHEIMMSIFIYYIGNMSSKNNYKYYMKYNDQFKNIIENIFVYLYLPLERTENNFIETILFYYDLENKIKQRAIEVKEENFIKKVKKSTLFDSILFELLKIDISIYIKSLLEIQEAIKSYKEKTLFQHENKEKSNILRLIKQEQYNFEKENGLDDVATIQDISEFLDFCLKSVEDQWMTIIEKDKYLEMKDFFEQKVIECICELYAFCYHKGTHLLKNNSNKITKKYLFEKMGELIFIFIDKWYEDIFTKYDNGLLNNLTVKQQNSYKKIFSDVENGLFSYADIDIFIEKHINDFKILLGDVNDDELSKIIDNTKELVRNIDKYKFRYNVPIISFMSWMECVKYGSGRDTFSYEMTKKKGKGKEKKNIESLRSIIRFRKKLRNANSLLLWNYIGDKRAVICLKGERISERIDVCRCELGKYINKSIKIASGYHSLGHIMLKHIENVEFDYGEMLSSFDGTTCFTEAHGEELMFDEWLKISKNEIKEIFDKKID